MIIITSKLNWKKDDLLKWQTQDINFITNHKVKVNFYLPKLTVKTIVTWECHVDESSESRYDMILGKYLLTVLGLYLDFSYNLITGGGRPFEGLTRPMIDLDM